MERLPQAILLGLENNVDVEDNEDASHLSAHSFHFSLSSSTYDHATRHQVTATGIQISPGAHAPANYPSRSASQHRCNK